MNRIPKINESKKKKKNTEMLIINNNIKIKIEQNFEQTVPAPYSPCSDSCSVPPVVHFDFMNK